MSGPTSDRRKIGDIRPSQLLYTYGVGSIVELPNLSVMVMGLEDWPIEQGATEIPRVSAAEGRSTRNGSAGREVDDATRHQRIHWFSGQPLR